MLVESEMPDLGALIARTTRQIQNHDVRVALPRYLAEFGTGLSLDELLAQASPDIQTLFSDEVFAAGMTDVHYARACSEDLPALRHAFAAYFARTGVAAIVFPATRVPAPLIDADACLTIGGREVPFDAAIARNVAPGSTAGLPGLVLPIGLTAAGLPVSLEFDAAAGQDRALLALGLSLETLFGPLPRPRL